MRLVHKQVTSFTAICLVLAGLSPLISVGARAETPTELHPLDVAVDTLHIEDLQLYQTAMELLENDQPVESLPYFTACAAAMHRQWYFHVNRAVALVGASQQALTVEHRREPLMRSSYERMGCLQLALGELELAEAEAPSSAAKAQVITQQAYVLSWAGSPVDALERYQRAVKLDANLATEMQQYQALSVRPCAPMPERPK